jgi:hypothetical protein
MRFPASLAATVLLLALAVPARADFLLAAGKETALLLNRTPAIFLTDPPGAKTDLKARARAQIDGKTLRVTLSWEDPTEDAVSGSKRAAYGSGPIYRKPTEKTDRFGDAAAMMVPAEKGVRFPGIMMGDPAREVRISLWRAGAEPETLRGRGRGTVEKAPGAAGFSAAQRRSGSRREVAFTVREFDPELPVAFAIWEGASGDRNGYKWYSPWYLVRP